MTDVDPGVEPTPQFPGELSPAARQQMRAWQGTIAIVCGGVLLGLIVLDTQLSLRMPHFWYQSKPMIALAVPVLLYVGASLLRTPPVSAGGWRPTLPGQRFHELRLYTRTGCHLCEVAAGVLARYAAWLPAVVEIDIDADPDSLARFDTSVPVVELDGEVRFRGEVSEVLLRRLIEGTPPG